MTTPAEDGPRDSGGNAASLGRQTSQTFRSAFATAILRMTAPFARIRPTAVFIAVILGGLAYLIIITPAASEYA